MDQEAQPRFRVAAVRHVYSLAKKILDTPEPNYGLFKHEPASALQWLHSLVDGEIDVDRADYLLRDGQALGLDFAQYDLDRLVSSLVLVKTPDRGYATAVKEPGLAALESYCLTRSRSHQVFVRHHKVCQVGTALRFACSQFMYSASASPLLHFLGKLKELDSNELRAASLSEYAALDDAWCFQGLRSLQKESHGQLLKACLDGVLDRAPKLRSLWKRKGDLTSQQLEILRTRIKDMTSPQTAAEIKKYSKPADPWRLRDDFLRMKPDLGSALSFLGKWGRWKTVGAITDLSEMIDLQRAISRALISWPKEWLSSSLSSHINLNSRTNEFPYLSMLTDSCDNAIRMATTIDLLKRLKFRPCARPDCGVPFPITSKHRKDYCSQYCGHLESVRRNRKPKKARVV